MAEMHAAHTFWLGLGLGLVLFVGTSAASAQTAAPCLPSRSVARQFGSPLETSAVAEQLESAWNAGDLTAAKTLFAVDAVAASSSGMRWQGQAEMGEFLIQLWDPTRSGGHSRVETQSRCVSGDQLVWIFRYAPSGATGTADLVVHGDQITHIFWSFVPSSADASGPDGGDAPGAPGYRRASPNNRGRRITMGGHSPASARCRLVVGSPPPRAARSAPSQAPPPPAGPSPRQARR